MSDATAVDTLDDILVNEEDLGAGTISISEKVFSAIITKFTLQIEDVIALGSAGFVGGLVEMIGKKTSTSPVQVEIENDCVQVTVNAIVSFGAHIPSVAEEIQSVVSSKVEDITGKSVAKVNVIISDLKEIEEKEATTDDTEEAIANV
mgnify:CR=1 FL=1